MYPPPLEIQGGGAMDVNARRLLSTELMKLIEVRQVARRMEVEAAIEGLSDWKGSEQAAL